MIEKRAGKSVPKNKSFVKPDIQKPEVQQDKNFMTKNPKKTSHDKKSAVFAQN